MKRRRAVLLAVVVGTSGWGSLACDKAAPTEPARAFTDMRPQKVDAAAPLSKFAGGWSGTITFHSFDGNNEALACDGPEGISVNLEQNGADLTGRFRTGCAGDLWIHGIVAGDSGAGSLAGSLDSPNGPSLGRISGSLGLQRITFKTVLTVGENGDGSTNRGGSKTVVSSDVELHRQASAAREHPVLTNGRPSRGINVQR